MATWCLCSTTHLLMDANPEFYGVPGIYISDDITYNTVFMVPHRLSSWVSDRYKGKIHNMYSVTQIMFFLINKKMGSRLVQGRLLACYTKEVDSLPQETGVDPATVAAP